MNRIWINKYSLLLNMNHSLELFIKVPLQRPMNMYVKSNQLAIQSAIYVVTHAITQPNPNHFNIIESIKFYLQQNFRKTIDHDGVYCIVPWYATQTNQFITVSISIIHTNQWMNPTALRENSSNVFNVSINQVFLYIIRIFTYKIRIEFVVLKNFIHSITYLAFIPIHVCCMYMYNIYMNVMSDEWERLKLPMICLTLI